MKRSVFCMMSFFSATGILSAQDGHLWTLEDCINYALEKNIQLQQDRLSLQESEVEVKSAKASLFPNLSFGMNHNVINRPYQETSNTVSGSEVIQSNNNTTYNGNYSLNAQWTLWNGGKRLKDIRQQKTNRDIADLTVHQTENSLKESILQTFVQILYADESVKINKGTLEVSEATYKRGVELLKEGNISKVDLAQLEAQVQNDRYSLVESESALRNYKLQLKQLLELDDTQPLEIQVSELDDKKVLKLLPSQNEVFQAAMAQRPEIQSAMLNIENAKIGISSAKAGYFPTISLSASTSSLTNSASSATWAQQIKYGWNNMVGLSLSIPIFDNRQNKTNVEKAKIQLSSAKLQQMNAQKQLYSTVESLWLDALNAQKQFQAADAKQKSCMESFNMVNEQFNLGMKNTVELLTEKNNLLSAQQQRVQAKYMAILNRTLLDFYAGNDLSI